NASRELYLPDVFDYARKKKKRIYAHHFSNADLLMGVNNMRELAQAQRALYKRTAERLMDDGTFVMEPDCTYVGPQVKVGKGCIIGPFTSISGESVLGDYAQIGAHCSLSDAKIGDRTLIRNSTVIEKSSVGKECAIGPMAYLRPGSKLSDHVRVGNFVEIKESSLGSHTSAAHLSY